MNQIAGVDSFSLMNNLRLVVIVAIFIILIIVLFYNRILGSLKRVKQKDMQAVNPSDDSGREERHASDVVGDFFGKEESAENEISKGGESAVESEVVIDGQPAVNYEKIEADLKAVEEEVTTKIEGLISKVEAAEKEVLNKIEDVIDAKIQEASNKINDRISEAVRTQINSINPVSEERVDSLRKDEVPKEINEKEQADSIALSGGIEEKISVGDVGGSADFDIQNVLEEEPVSIPSTEEPKELVEEKVEFEEKKKRDLEAPVKDSDIMEKFRLFVRYQLDAFDILPFDESKTVAEEKKERELNVSSEVKKDVKIDEKESVKAITSTGKIEEKISKGGVGKSVGPARIFFQRFLSIGIPSTKEPKESVEGKVEFEEKKERDLEASVEDSDVLPSEDTVVPEEIKEEEQADTIVPSGGIEEKISERDVGESVDFDIEKLLEEEPVGIPSAEEPKELVEEKAEFEEKKERDLEAPVGDSDILEKLAGSLQMNEDPFGILPSEDTVVPEEIKEKEQTDTIAPSGEVEEKIPEGDVGESVDFDIEKLLEEEPVGMPSTEEPKGSVEEKVEFMEEKEEDLELPAEEAVAHEGIDEKAIEAAKGEEVEEKKQSTGETADFDIQEFLEELGTPPSEKE